MKTLMSASVVPADEYATSWTISDPGYTPLTAKILESQSPCDWREHLKLIAKKKKWWLRKAHLKDVRSMVKFLVKKGFFYNPEGIVILDEWEGAFNLPAGSAVIGWAEGREPFLAVWEEDMPPF